MPNAMLQAIATMDASTPAAPFTPQNHGVGLRSTSEIKRIPVGKANPMHITPCGRARSLTSATGTPYGYQFPIYRVANDCLTAPIAFFTWVGNVYRLPMLQWRADAVEPVALPYGL